MPSSPKTLSRLRRKNRIRAKISGSTARPRLVVFRSNSYISAQVVDDSSGKIIASAHDLKAKKGSKVERAGSVGKALAEAAMGKKVETVVFDRNGYKYHGRVKALADAAREAGLKF